jgi:adenosylcobyric acid synthase
LANRIVALADQGTPIVGICGGYQMLGHTLADPNGVEAEPGACADGLGLLPIRTTFSGDKHTVQVQATVQAPHGPFAALKETVIRGYEIHMGRSEPIGTSLTALCRIGNPATGHLDGTLNPTGRIWGTYLHGIFDNDALRHAWLRSLGWHDTGHNFDRQLAYHRLADHAQTHLDMPAIERIIWGDQN